MVISVNESGEDAMVYRILEKCSSITAFYIEGTWDMMALQKTSEDKQNTLKIFKQWVNNSEEAVKLQETFLDELAGKNRLNSSALKNIRKLKEYLKKFSDILSEIQSFYFT